MLYINLLKKMFLLFSFKFSFEAPVYSKETLTLNGGEFYCSVLA